MSQRIDDGKVSRLCVISIGVCRNLNHTLSFRNESLYLKARICRSIMTTENKLIESNGTVDINQELAWPIKGKPNNV